MAVNRDVPSQAPFAVWVQKVVMVSETDPKQTYEVQLQYCPCLSFRYNVIKTGKMECKHILLAQATFAQWFKLMAGQTMPGAEPLDSASSEQAASEAESEAPDPAWV